MKQSLLTLLVSVLTGCVTAAEPPPAPELSTAPTQVLSVPDSELHNPLVFVIYGDMRFTDPGETVAASPGPRQALVDKVAAEHPDALFLTGDIPWHGGDMNDYRVFEAQTAAWRQQHLRVYPVLGNHEFSQCDAAQCLENWWRAFPQIQGWRWYAVALGSRVRAFALDSNTSLLTGSEQRQWLQQQLGSLPPTVRFVILTLHHPPVADTGFAIVRRNERALGAYLKSVARGSSARFIVCSGHVHNYERFERDGVVYLVSGGGGAKPLRVHRGRRDKYRESGFPNFHYIRFEMQGERLQVQMHKVTDYQADSPHEWAVKDRFEVTALPPTAAATPASPQPQPAPPAVPYWWGETADSPRTAAR
jgi:acid phosphatase type 7